MAEANLEVGQAVPALTLTITLTNDDIVALAGEDDWLWRNVIVKRNDNDIPTALDTLYWACRDAYCDNLRRDDSAY